MNLDSPTLLASARRWMSTGLEKYVSDEDLDFAVHHFGVATEHLMKAYLASLHPALVVDAVHFPSLLHATGHAQIAGVSPSETRSIGGAEAFRRCLKLLKTAMPINEAGYQPLLNARNGVSHAGHHDGAKAVEHLIIAIRVCDSLLQAIGADEQQFWGQFAPLRAEVLSARNDELRLRFEAETAAARVRLDRLDAESRGLLERIAAEPDPAKAAWPQQCPVCGSLGRLTGDVEAEPEIVGEEADGTPRLGVVAFLWPDLFTCRVCGVKLPKDLFGLADLPSSVWTDWEGYSVGPDTWVAGRAAGEDGWAAQW